MGAVDIRRHLTAAFFNAFHQHQGINGIAAGADLGMRDLLYHPYHFIREQIAVVLDGDLQAVFFNSRNVALEILHDLRHLDHGSRTHAGMRPLCGMLHIRAVFYQCAAELMGDLQGFFDRAVYTGI